MRISTSKCRRIERARQTLTKSSWGMNVHYDPCLNGVVTHFNVSLDGKDGVTYTVSLDEADIATLNAALVTYKQDYPQHFGHQLVRRDPDKAR